MPIYTRTGDLGKTSLFGGKRVLKSAPIVDAYGSVDELNSWVGLIISDFDILYNKKRNNYQKIKITRNFLVHIQSDLLTIGSNLSGWKTDLTKLENRVVEMEREIDNFESKLPKLQNFILPGGSSVAAKLHLTRNICRRLERQLVALNNKSKVDLDLSILKYINRLSDLFFDLARYINNSAGIKENIWIGINSQARLNNIKNKE